MKKTLLKLYLNGSLAVVSLGITFCACTKSAPLGGSTSTTSIPLLTPVVKAAIPSGLGGNAAHSSRQSGVHSLDENDNGSGNGADLTSDIAALKSRFFDPQGPTEIVGQLMPSLDSLITNINTMASSSTSPCLTQAPVSYVITPGGQNVTMYAQCYVAGTAQYSAGTSASAPNAAYAADPAFTQFGINNGVIYVFSAWGAEWVGAIVTPLANSQYSVKAYLGVGYSNAATMNSQGNNWDSGSYGLIEFYANTATGTFELATAGSGLGYCGAQLISNGSTIYAEVSNDMGTTCGSNPGMGTNGVTADLCVSATDLTAASNGCPTASDFTLYPIGRIGGTLESPSAANSQSTTSHYASSTYPASPNVLFNGTSSDALHFGPTVPTTGVGQLTGGNSSNNGNGNGGGGTPTVSGLATAITTACSSVSSGDATAAATAALAVYTSGGQNAAITALNTSLSGAGYNSTVQTCADNAVENSN